LGLFFGFLSGDISIGCFATAVGRGFNYEVYGSGTLDAAIYHNPKIFSLILYSVLHLRVLLAITFVAFVNTVLVRWLEQCFERRV